MPPEYPGADQQAGGPGETPVGTRTGDSLGGGAGGLPGVLEAGAGVVQQVLAQPRDPSLEPITPPPHPGGDGDSDTEEDHEDSEAAGTSVHERQRKRPPTRAEVAFALREAKGDKRVAAAALGLKRRRLQQIVAEDDQLRALFAIEGPGGTAVNIEAPDLNDSRTRTPSDLPDGVTNDLDLADIVGKADKMLFRRDLKKMGVGEKMLEKIKSLEGMALSGGQFLAASFQMSHQLYFLQLLGLDEQLDYVRKILKEDSDKSDPKEKMSHFDRVFYFKAYSAMVAESARGYRLMQAGTESLIRMLRAGGNKPGDTKRAKPGWGVSSSQPAAGGENGE